MAGHMDSVNVLIGIVAVHNGATHQTLTHHLGRQQQWKVDGLQIPWYNLFSIQLAHPWAV